MLSGEVGEVVGVECRGEGCGRGLSVQVLFVGKDVVVEEIRRESAACWIVESRVDGFGHGGCRSVICKWGERIGMSDCMEQLTV